MFFVDLTVQGLVQGATYALIALGLTLVYGLFRILHVAHAALFTLGAYPGVIVANQAGSFALALAVAMVVVGVIGIGIRRFAYKPMLAQPPLAALIASEEIYRLVFGTYSLSFTIRKGEIFGLIGANGAGKTSTILALTGLIPIRAGTILLDGNDITAVPTHARVDHGIALVPGPDPGPPLSVRNPLRSRIRPGKIRCVLQADRRAVMFG
jgi:hypothetical protein